MIKKFFSKHYSLHFFIFILLYNFVVTRGFELWTIDSGTYTYYLVDFSMGFCSKFLPGAIYNFFFDDTSTTAVSIFAIFLFLLCAALISIMLEKILKNADEKNKNLLLFLFVFLLTGPSLLPMCIYRIGSHDVFWILFFLLSILFLSNKRLYILIVPMCMLSVTVNYGSLVSFIPAILLMMIYKITLIQEKKEKKWLWFTTILSLLSAVLLSAYFMIFEHSNLTYTFEEFTAILNERGYVGEPYYFGSNLYDIEYYEEINYEHLESIQSPFIYAIAHVYYRVVWNFAYISMETIIAPLLLSLPVIILIFSFLKTRIKDKEEKKLKRFVVFCMLAMFFFILLGGVFLSTDIVRFWGHAYTLLFAFFLYIVYNEKNDNLQHMSDCIAKIPKPVVALYFMCYLFMVFDPTGQV